MTWRILYLLTGIKQSNTSYAPHLTFSSYGLVEDCQDTTIPLTLRAVNVSKSHFYLDCNPLTHWWDPWVFHLGVFIWSLHKHTMPTTSLGIKVIWICSSTFALPTGWQFSVNGALTHTKGRVMRVSQIALPPHRGEAEMYS